MTRECCYDICDCRCKDVRGAFDSIIQNETRLTVRLRDLCHSNISWFVESEPERLDSLRGRSGVYILWHKDGYCDIHDLFHMRALYVGKGAFAARIYTHQNTKDFSEQMIVYWTLVEMPNRHSKYVEQLLLDLYDFPLNKSENCGTEVLCGYLTQGEVD